MAVLDHPLGPLEYHRHPGAGGPVGAVFLHEGLGSVAQWGTLPGRFAAATGMPTLVYSRHGYGGSGGSFRGGADYLVAEADTVLPEVLDRIGAVADPLLVGHSDGASIALAYAAHRPVRGVVAIAPHVVVETRTLDGIRRAAGAFADVLEPKLRPYHDDPAALFAAWSQTWLGPDFAAFDLSDRLARIAAPVLVVQGELDQYGTERQLSRIAELVRGRVGTALLPAVAHHPHLEAGTETLRLVADFVESLDGRDHHVT